MSVSGLDQPPPKKIKYLFLFFFAVLDRHSLDRRTDQQRAMCSASARYAEAMEAGELRRWFFDALTPRDTPLTLLLEWLAGESVDLINRASAMCAHRPYVPVPAAHASEWVCAVVARVMQDERCGEELERVLASHSLRIPWHEDVKRAASGTMTLERPDYGCGAQFSLRMRTVADFAPRTVAQATNMAEPPADEPAELAALKRLRDGCARHSPAVACITRRWLLTLAEHYDGAATLAAHYDHTPEARLARMGAADAARRELRQLAVQVAAQVVGDVDVVADCLSRYADRVSRALFGPGSASHWSAAAVGLPGAVGWSALSRSAEQVAAVRQRLSRDGASPCAAATAAPSPIASFMSPSPASDDDEDRQDEEEDEDEEQEDEGEGEGEEEGADEPAQKRTRSKAHAAAAAATSPPQPQHVTRFSERLDVPGMARLLETGWRCDAENVAAVVGPQFRELILEVKRGVQGCQRICRWRAVLPTHPYMQTITKALSGKTHMYGSEGDSRVDDFDAARNPGGCPPWVLAAVVAAACSAGMRHIVDNARQFRLEMEQAICGASASAAAAAAARKRKHAQHVFTIAGERINFPLKFVDAISALMGRGAAAAAGSRSKRKAAPASPEQATTEWRGLDDATKDELALDTLSRHLSGMNTLLHHMESAAPEIMPAWLVAYVQYVASSLDSGTIRDVATGEAGIVRWHAEFEAAHRQAQAAAPAAPPPEQPSAAAAAPPPEQTPPPPPPMTIMEFNARTAEALRRGEKLSAFVFGAMTSPPGISPPVIWHLQNTDWLFKRLLPNLQEMVLEIAKMSLAEAEDALSGLQTRGGGHTV